MKTKVRGGMDPQSGFCPSTKAFLSLRPAVSLPPPSLALSYTSFALSDQPPSIQSNAALIDASTGASLSFASFSSRVFSLASILRSSHGLSRGQVAFVVSHASIDLPVLYFSLLSLGVTVAPANPACTPSELSRLAGLAAPSLIITHSSVAPNLPPALPAPVLLLDSPTFRSPGAARIPPLPVAQSDTAAILFSSGTTGRTKAAAIAHRSFIAMTAGYRALNRRPGGGPGVTMIPAPMFHSMGFFFALNVLAMGDTLVLMDRPTFPEIMRAAERYGATEIVAAPPVVLAMARPGTPDLPKLERVTCGGAPLPAEAAGRFLSKFQGVLLCQGYGSTEAGGISRMIDAEECRHQKSAGRLSENVEGKIVSPLTGEPQCVGQPGELWLRGPALMKGYVGDEEANGKAFDAEGWLKTGDLCYFDQNGFLYVVDRLKELIKYKAYQVPPAELEHILLSLPEIIDVAVIPFPQEEVGQIPVAFVVRHPGSTITEADIMNYVAKQVAPYKKIRKVSFVESIPKSVSGKILRKELASNYAKSVPATLMSRI